MKLYNTLTRNVEDFEPSEGKTVNMYTCGITVYSQPHIGNWLAYIYSDVLHRILLADGWGVNRVQNITDVGHLTDDADDGEDKMAKGAKAEKTTAWAIADKYIGIVNDEGYNKLGLLKPELVRATDEIEEQIEFNKQLEAKGYTYQIPGKGLYFDTSKLDDYGKLARLDIKGLQSGKRIDDSGKRNPTDFVLWRLSPKDLDPDVNWEWDSPWGKGIPGWHLECSEISRKHLGDQIDIHTGGIDHIPVHHTNEIAQTESLTGKKPFSRFWFHNNHIKVNGTKISKSLGNVFTLQDVIDKGYSLDAFKIMVLSSHYQTEGNFTWEILEAAQNRLDNWLAAVDLIWQEDKAVDGAIRADLVIDEIEDALNDNLDTPKTLEIIDKTFSQVNKLHFCKPCIESIVDSINTLLGINLMRGKSDINKEQKELLDKRSIARQQKDWTSSDQIRDTLLEQGIKVKDGPTGQTWTRIMDRR